MSTSRFNAVPTVFGLVAATLLTLSLSPSRSYGQSTQPAAQKTFIDYFLPTPIQGTLSKDAWGAAEVGPRDQKNGLEDTTIKQWCYWDGQIIKAPDGKYHMFASRWDQSAGHRGWGNSKAVHAVSDNLFGPYEDKGLCFADSMEGRGHNVTALVLPNNEGYGIVVSETRPGAVFVSKSLDGPWTMKGLLSVEGQPDWKASNVSLMVRPDGDFEIVPRNGQAMISKAAAGILGPYTVVGPTYPTQRNLEDPAIWYSGGMYHVIVNNFGQRKTFHYTSKDGKTNWVNRGLAIDPTRDIIKYTDGTLNHWSMMERPGVYLENGHVKAVTVAALNVRKQQELGNDTNGSKILVIPFDGEAFDRDMAKIVAAEDAAAGNAPAR